MGAGKDGGEEGEEGGGRIETEGGGSVYEEEIWGEIVEEGRYEGVEGEEGRGKG